MLHLGRRAKFALGAAAGAALFTAHVISEFVPDALGIGLACFCFGVLGGILATGDVRRGPPSRR